MASGRSTIDRTSLHRPRRWATRPPWTSRSVCGWLPWGPTGSSCRPGPGRARRSPPLIARPPEAPAAAPVRVDWRGRASGRWRARAPDVRGARRRLCEGRGRRTEARARRGVASARAPGDRRTCRATTAIFCERSPRARTTSSCTGRIRKRPTSMRSTKIGSRADSRHRARLGGRLAARVGAAPQWAGFRGVLVYLEPDSWTAVASAAGKLPGLRLLPADRRPAAERPGSGSKLRSRLRGGDGTLGARFGAGTRTWCSRRRPLGRRIAS